MAGVLDSIATSARAVRSALADADLARMLIAWLAINAGSWGFIVVTVVVAYDDGGAVAVGLLGLARYLPATVLAPLAGLPSARWPGGRVLLAVDAGRAAAVAITLVVVASGGGFALLAVGVAIEASFGAFTRPLQMGLLPSLARSPGQLVAANVASSAAEGLGTFVGPALAGLLLARAGTEVALVGMLLLDIVAVLALVRLHVPEFVRERATVRAAVGQVLAGVRVVGDAPGPRLILIGLGIQTMVRGMLGVLIVVSAIELLGMGDGGVGLLNAAIGIGGLIGAAGAIGLMERRRLIPAFDGALAAWSTPIALVGLAPLAGVAILAMVAVGAANALIDVAGFTLLQRLTPNERRIALLGLVDSVASGGVAVGGLLAPALIAAVGIQPALVVTGAILPVTALLLWPLLRRVDEQGTVDPTRIALVHHIPLFAPLSLAATEHIAACLRPVHFPAGAVLMAEGGVGDRYVVLATGTADVHQDAVLIRTVGSGDGVGEIALLRDVPRTATVTARSDIDGWELAREDFLSAVCGDTLTLRVADETIDAHRARDVQPGDLH